MKMFQLWYTKVNFKYDNMLPVVHKIVYVLPNNLSLELGSEETLRIGVMVILGLETVKVCDTIDLYSGCI